MTTRGGWVCRALAFLLVVIAAWSTAPAPADAVATGHSYVYDGVIRLSQASADGLRRLGHSKPQAAPSAEAVARSTLTTTRFAAKGGNACKIDSFTGNTRVLMADGSTRPIKNLDIGDKVMAADPGSGRAGARRVDDVLIGDGKKHLVDITIATGNETNVVTATGKHPFWVPKARRWIDAEDLHAGDRLATSTGQTAQIVRTRVYDQVSQVYNLTVHDLHTYYVMAGNAPVLVHNCGGEAHRSP